VSPNEGINRMNFCSKRAGERKRKKTDLPRLGGKGKRKAATVLVREGQAQKKAKDATWDPQRKRGGGKGKKAFRFGQGFDGRSHKGKTRPGTGECVSGK